MSRPERPHKISLVTAYIEIKIKVGGVRTIPESDRDLGASSLTLKLIISSAMLSPPDLDSGHGDVYGVDETMFTYVWSWGISAHTGWPHFELRNIKLLGIIM